MISIAPSLLCWSQPRLLSITFRRLGVGLLLSLIASVISITAETPLIAIANQVSTPTEETLPADQAEIIVLGRLPQHHYVVIIPVSTLTSTTKEPITTTSQFVLLQKIRTIVPQSFLARHSLGQYIYVGGFEKFGLAQQQLRQIQLRQIQPNISNARVVYFP